MTRTELLGIIQDGSRPCVDRGEAVTKLRNEYGLAQANVAEKTSLSAVAVSHLKTCFLNLRGRAREICKGGRMNADACYAVAKATDFDQDRILSRAIEFGRIRDSRRPVQKIGPRGRQSPEGQITDDDIKQAIHAEERKD